MQNFAVLGKPTSTGSTVGLMQSTDGEWGVELP